MYDDAKALLAAAHEARKLGRNDAAAALFKQVLELHGLEPEANEARAWLRQIAGPAAATDEREEGVSGVA